MDGAGVRRAVRDVTLVAVVTGIMTLSLLVIGGLLLAPELSKVGGNVEGECRGAQTPTLVLDRWEALGSEGSAPQPSMSWFPYGTRCTWTLDDGSTVWKDAPWDTTLAMAGALAVAGGAVVLLAWSGRRSTRELTTRRSRLAEMTRHAAEDGLYEASADDYREALSAARHER